ncbi:MAG: RodZ domain-containing protein [Parcubacteria group bacterium]|jgi:cytoskeletal protein RodZ
MIRGFTRKQVNSYTLGEQLKKIRSEGRVTLSEVSRDTKIPMKYLVMIEESEYEKLPPDVYVKGFLRSYGEYLGIEPRKLIELYQRERDIKNNLNPESKPLALQKKSKVTKFVVTPKMITTFIIAVVLIGGFYYIYRQVGRFAAVPRLVVTEPATDQSVDGNSVVISGFTDPDDKLTINGQPVLVSDKGAFRENIILQSGVNPINIEATNNFGKVSSESISITSNYENQKVAEDQNTSEEGRVSGDEDVKTEGVKLEIRVDGLPTWVNISTDGELAYSGTMLPGSNQEFQAASEVRVTSGKANQTFIKVNGGDEKILANDPGIVRDVVFGPND